MLLRPCVNLLHRGGPGGVRLLLRAGQAGPGSGRKATLSCSAQLASKKLLFTRDHEWIRVEGGVGTVGISDYAQDALGDVVYAQLPDPDERVECGGECGALESVKAASEIISPVTGVVTQKNEAVEKAPALINSSPMDEGWLFKVQLEKEEEETKQLMTEEQYSKFLKAQEEEDK